MVAADRNTTREESIRVVFIVGLYIPTAPFTSMRGVEGRRCRDDGNEGRKTGQQFSARKPGMLNGTGGLCTGVGK